ncbi:MAG: hypothetical protein IPL49_09860 [Saprospirales bacterium]|nr:hypothetical protein [Saprospirales bacterium]MBK8491171.1 hypothetical protein [Saprospirales bacterium]
MIYKYLAKYGQLLGFALGAIPILLFVLIFLIGGEDAAINFELYSGIALLIIGIVVLVAWSLYQIAANPGGSLKGILGVGVLVVVFLVIYFTATPEVTGSLGKTRIEFNISDAQTKLITGGIGLAVIMAIAASLSFVYSEVRNFFK